MPDFSADLTAGGAPAIWVDPATPTAASRLNDIAGKPRRYWKVTAPTGTGIVVVQLAATIGGTTGPSDSTLGGRLFLASWVQWSGPRPPLVPVAGSSSIVNVHLTAQNRGFFAVLFWRPGGGAVVVNFNVEPQ